MEHLTFAPDRIHQADCLSALPALPPGMADLVFADPPFNIGYDYDVYDDSRDRDHYLQWSRQWIEAVHRVLKPTGTFWLAIGDEYAAELKVLSQEVGFTCRSWVVWYYTFGVNCTRKFNRSHAHLFQFVKNPKDFTFNAHAIRVPSARQLVYADSRANPDGRLPDDTWILRPQNLVDGFTPDEDTWYFPRVAGTFKERAGFHGCQMPEQLLGRIIRCSSNSGELVLDPFAGSATTLAVARKLGRRWLGFELSEDYVRRGLARLDSVEEGDPLEGAPEPLVSAPATGRNGARRGRNGGDARKNKKRTKTSQPATKPDLAQVTPNDQEAGLIEAFRRSSEGFSIDRVVADPELNEAFLDSCGKLGISEKAFDLNRMLFRLRKAGKLAHIPTTRRTELDWGACDPYIFASEIAWSRMLDDGIPSLDDVLCSPEKAQRFDKHAALFAPGFRPLEYRWAALKLRKLASSARRSSESVPLERLSERRSILDLDLRRVPSKPGLYIVSIGEHDILYIGETLDLRARLDRKFKRESGLKGWLDEGKDPQVRHLIDLPKQNTLSQATLPTHLIRYQSWLIRTHNSKMNSRELKHDPKFNLRDLAMA